MNDNNKNQIIMRCECEYCRMFLQDYGDLEVLKNQTRENGLDDDMIIEDVVTKKNVTVGGKQVVLNKNLYKAEKELRGIYITTVRNNDFPSIKVFENGKFNVKQFKKEFIDILVQCSTFNLNALFIQIRPEGDAFYASKLNPWSEYLTGKQGIDTGLNGFDPLSWMIEKTHEIGLEFHAWFNPYRLTPTSKRNLSKEELFNLLGELNYAKKHPEDTFYFDRQLFLNPGIPRVINHVVNSIMEVVYNYNIDAVHLDDFFYPYAYEVKENDKVNVITFSSQSLDQKEYDTYHKENQTIDMWREDNINTLVRKISNEITNYNKVNESSIAFGISPFGVFGSAEKTNGVGSNTSSEQLSSLEVYVNSKLWVDEEWIDYIVPQNYWSFTDKLSPFGEVAIWWSAIVKDKKTQLYMGLGLYLYESDQANPAWQNPKEIRNQILYGRSLENVEGFVFFTYQNLLSKNAQNNEQDTSLEQAVAIVKQDLLSQPVLIPPRPWLQRKELKHIQKLDASKSENQVILSFIDSRNNSSQYYAIYRVEGESIDKLQLNQQYLLDVIGKKGNKAIQYYKDLSAEIDKGYTYGITALSQAQVESEMIKTVYYPKG